MERLNYNHLRCFWAVAREGSVVRAGERLGLSQPTVSKQLGDLEDALGEALFRRVGRRLVLTDVGRTVHSYAEDIFELGQEILDVVRGRATGRPARLHVGVSDVVPKLLTRLVLESAVTRADPVRLVCHEGKTEQLLADLALAGLDFVLTDAPLPAGSRIKAFSHKLGESPIAVFGPREHASRYRDGFPGSIDGAPLLLPTENTALRRSIDGWLEKHSLSPRVVAEFEDSALLKSFAEAGHGLFFAPTAVESVIRRQLGAEEVGRAERIFETLYAVTLDRRVASPIIGSIMESARERLSG